MVKIGIIGAGDIASHVHIPILSSIKEVKIVFAADIKLPQFTYPGNIKKIKVENPKSLPDCDILLLATPVGVREQYIREFGRRNIPIFSEKPFGINIEMHKLFLELSKKITCNYMRKYYSAVNQMKWIKNMNIFGRLQRVRIFEGGIAGKTGKAKDHYQTQSRLSGGSTLIERGSHTFSAITHILDDCTFFVKKASVLYRDDLDIDTEALIDAKNRREKYDVDYHITSIKNVKNKTIFHFENAVLSFDQTMPNAQISIFPVENKGEKLVLSPSNTWATTFYQAFYLKWTDFLTKIKTHASLDVLEETSLKTTQIITDIYKKGSQ